MNSVRVAVVGAGAFGRNHIRIVSQMPGITLAAVIDADESRARELADQYDVPALTSVERLAGVIDAAVVATPTQTHEAIATALLQQDIDVMVEKPIASSAEAGERLVSLAKNRNRILQVGHLERFNPAVVALSRALTVPLFFEVHRLSVFTPRSLDVDVILDLMIHDLDIVLSLTGEQPEEIRAAGISVLSSKVDIANVRLAFPSGCIANLTASRVSTEKVRKLRVFQPGQYISLDYACQDASVFSVSGAGANAMPDIGFSALPVEKGEPLQLELASFVQAIRSRTRPVVDGRQATEALHLAELILAKIKEHGSLMQETVRRTMQLPGSQQPSPRSDRH